ncbi:Golgin subfamily A member 7/ERF4 [Penicillium concentricum]|uniref:Golgin subfamily A member 7/ERF4 n=1 Tax=Penicillium concentricum TaxID=293559 RepID=A0A9W9UZ05_9EURO|nr:Golgin subfamily A member 7/ERF4 [Penicillium concentricum]KAJ5360370.1 Golgin subfamily A member 7/ERF4 [Penicillium concentricum]
MRWSLLFTLIVSLLLLGTLAAPASGLGRRGVEVANLEARQEKETDPTISDAETATQTDISKAITDASTAAEATTTGTTAFTTGSTTARTHATTDATTTTSAASATSTVPSLDGTTASSQQDAVDSTRPTYSGGLPIKPTITPAWGVGGFILIALGAVLTFIGVRKQWVQIFLSTGFLSALGVTVLIIYVMSPPVTNAVQGGYLVAVFFTGAVFGGLSLVFREICEGLGCLLGGFCLSMWFLALKAGGLLSEGGPKAGMIIAFTVGFYSLSFSHYTRPYGLIGCTSFSGATAVVIGIDCYSRAGLKEFWLYIWGLNQNVFPLRTDTYPVTRGIRVELAATIIISVLGVISQIRLWNLIKERRAKEEDSRRAHTRKIEEEDAEAGRRLEEKNIQERAEWELIYGNGKAADGKAVSVSETAVGDSRRGSDGFDSSDNDKEGQIELKEMPSPDASGSASDGEKNREGEKDRELEAVPEEDSSQQGQSRDADEGKGAEKQSPSEGKTPRPTTPVVTHVLGEGNDESSENGADIGSEVGTPRSKRFSGREMLSRLSWRNGNGVMTASQSQENLVDHDDANSSVLGVVDDLHEMSVGCPSVISDADVHDRVEKTQPTQQETSTAELAPEKDSTNVEIKSNAGSQAVPDAELRVDTAIAQKDTDKVITKETTADRTVPQVSLVENAVVSDCSLKNVGISELSEKPQLLETTATDIQAYTPDASKKTEEVKPKVTLEPSPLNDAEEERVKEANEDQPPTAKIIKPESTPELKVVSLPEPKVEPKIKVLKTLDASTVKCIPEQTSRVIHSYRTNEWAKHLADADTPEMEPIEFEPEPEAEYPEEVHETAAFVDIGGLLQTPLTAQPPPIVNRPEYNDMDNQPPVYISSLPSPDIPQSKTRTGAQGLTTAKPTLTRNDSTASVNILRSASGPLPTQESGLRSIRNTSTPLLTITTPNEPKETEPPSRWNGPPPLLAVRENMVRNRMSSTSNRFDPWAARNLSRQSLPEMTHVVSPISPPLSIPEEREVEHQVQPNEDDIPLSKRRALLQRQTTQSPAASPDSLEAASFPLYPQPAPATELNRSASRMAAWRQSVREEITQKRDPLALQSPPISPASPLDRPRSAWNSVQQMREVSSTQIGDAIADGMQRGNMTDLHRQAMRQNFFLGRSLHLRSNFPPLLSALKTASLKPHRPLSREEESFCYPRQQVLRPPTNRAPVESTPSFVRAQRRQCVPISGPPSLLRPPAVRLANPVNYVPRITPITVHPHQSDESLPLGFGHSRDAHPLLSVPERRRSRLTPSPSSLLVERSQGETESGRTSIALPPRHRRSEDFASTEMAFAGSAARETENLRPPEAVHLTQNGTRQNDRARYAQSQTSLRSQSQIASVPSNTGLPPADVAEELAWGPAHPCFPHINPHVPIGSREHMTTRVIRIRRDWMIKGDLAPTFSNLYPEILDPLLSEHEFRRVISTVNDGIIKAFDPFSLRNWFDGVVGLLTGWVWDDLNAPGTKSQLQNVEAWLENWNREVGAKDGVHIWSLRRTAYMSLDIQIPDPKVGIVPSEAPSAPNTRPSTGIGAGA